MKKSTIILLAFVFCTAALAIKVADDILTKLGLQAQNTQWHIMRNIIGRYDAGAMSEGVEDGPSNSVFSQLQSFQIPRATLLSAIITGDKSGAARDLCEYVKKYVNSEEFIAEYNKLKEDAMPLMYNGMRLSSLKHSSDVFRTNIRNYPNDTKYLAEQKQLLDENEKKVATMTEMAKKPFPGKDQWEKTYPADPAVLVKKRLQEYLQLVATVDFAAKLTGSGKKQTFVNPVYEKKSLKWKAIYRAGKDVNDVVTAFVKDWLKGEIISAAKTRMTTQANTPPATPPSAARNTQTVNQGNATTGTVTQSQPVQSEQPATSTPTPKPKKSLFNKIKEKANAVTGN